MKQRRGKKWMAVCTLTAMIGAQLSTVRINAHGDDDRGRGEFREESHEHEGPRTATPIKHVIVLIGENRTFDNVYATYVPKHGQHVSNLLSKGIVNADGSPGPNHALSTQFKLAKIDPVSFFIDTSKLNTPGKTACAVSAHAGSGLGAASGRDPRAVPERSRGLGATV